MSSNRKSQTQKNSRSNRSNILNYREFISRELRKLRDENPDLENTEYMKMAAKNWSRYKDKHGIVVASSGSKSSRSKSYRSKNNRSNRNY